MLCVFCQSYEFLTGMHIYTQSERKRPGDRQSLVWMPLYMMIISQHPPLPIQANPQLLPLCGVGVLTCGIGSALPKGITSLHFSALSAPLSVHCYFLSLCLSVRLISTQFQRFFPFHPPTHHQVRLSVHSKVLSNVV